MGHEGAVLFTRLMAAGKTVEWSDEGHMVQPWQRCAVRHTTLTRL
jgi:hypothetical protein